MALAKTRPDVAAEWEPGALRRGLAGGGKVALIEGAGAEARAETVAALDGDPARTLSVQAGGRGDPGAWLCLAFGLEPFAPEPGEARVAAWLRENGPALLVAPAAEKLDAMDLAALGRLVAGGRLSLLLAGSEGGSARLSLQGAAALSERLIGMATAPEAAAPVPGAPPPAGPRRDAFARIAEAAQRAAPAPPPAAAPRGRLLTLRRAFVLFMVAMAALALVAPELAPQSAAPAEVGRAPQRLASVSAGDAAPAVPAGRRDAAASIRAGSAPAPAALSAQPPERTPLAAPMARSASPDGIRPPRAALAFAPPSPEPRHAAAVEPLAPPAAPASFDAPTPSAATPEAEGPPAPRPRPETAGFAPAAPSTTPWVVIHHGPEAEEAAAALAARLAGGPFAHVELRRVGIEVGADQVRFFFEADAPLARDAAAALGGLTVRDFAAYRPSPRPKTLEVWLAPR